MGEIPDHLPDDYIPPEEDAVHEYKMNTYRAIDGEERIKKSRDLLDRPKTKGEELKELELMHASSFWDAYDNDNLQMKLERVNSMIAKPHKGIRRTPATIGWLEKVAEAIEFEIEARRARNPEN